MIMINHLYILGWWVCETQRLKKLLKKEKIHLTAVADHIKRGKQLQLKDDSIGAAARSKLMPQTCKLVSWIEKFVWMMWIALTINWWPRPRTAELYSSSLYFDLQLFVVTCFPHHMAWVTWPMWLVDARAHLRAVQWSQYGIQISRNRFDEMRYIECCCVQFGLHLARIFFGSSQLFVIFYNTTWIHVRFKVVEICTNFGENAENSSKMYYRSSFVQMCTADTIT